GAERVRAPRRRDRGRRRRRNPETVKSRPRFVGNRDRGPRRPAFYCRESAGLVASFFSSLAGTSQGGGSSIGAKTPTGRQNTNESVASHCFFMAAAEACSLSPAAITILRTPRPLPGCAL